MSGRRFHHRPLGLLASGSNARAEEAYGTPQAAVNSLIDRAKERVPGAVPLIATGHTTRDPLQRDGVLVEECAQPRSHAANKKPAAARVPETTT